MKKIAIVLGAIALVGSLSSCSKTCTCNVSKYGQQLDSYEFADVSSDECDAKVDEIFDDLMDNYYSESLVGVQVECSHL